MKYKTIITIMILITSLGYSSQLVKSQGSTDPLDAVIGTQSGELSADQEVWYALNVSVGQYTLELEGETGTDFDFYLYDQDMVLIDDSRETYYPEHINYVSQEDEILLIKIQAFEGSGRYNLTISFDEIESLELGLNQGKFSSSYQVHYYQLVGGDKYYNLTLTSEGNTGLYLNLLNENLTLISTGSGSYSKILNFYGELNQTYYVKVSNDYNTGVYDLYFSPLKIEFQDMGAISGNLEYGEAKEYYFGLKDAQYYFVLNGPEFSDFDLTLYDLNGYEITSSSSTVYPETMSYRSHTGQIVILEVYAYDGEGNFTIDISEILNVELPADFTPTNEEIGMDVYQVDNAMDKEITVSLEMLGEILYVAILDTNLDAQIIDALLKVSDSTFNPHNLADSYNDFEGIYGNHSLSYTSTKDTLYIVVYSFRAMAGYLSDMDTGYKLSSNMPFSEVGVSSDYEEYYPYAVSGTLSDNGDEYWDDGEFLIYTGYSLDANEYFDLLIYSDYTEYEFIVILFDGTTEDDINDALDAFYNYFEYGSELPSDIYSVTMSNYGLGTLSYVSDSALTFNIAIFFDIPLWSTSSSFTLFTSHDGSGTVLSDASGANLLFLPGLIALIGLVSYKRKFSY